MRILPGMIVFAFFFFSSAKGEEVTFKFGGAVHEMDGEFSYLSGQPFEITYTFDTAAGDTNSQDPECGNYVGAIKSGVLVIFNGREYFKWDIQPGAHDSFIEVRNLPSGDAYLAGANLLGRVYDNVISAHFLVELIDKSASALNGDMLPLSLQPNAFDRRHARLTFIGVRKLTYSTLGVITSADTSGGDSSH